MSEDLKKQLQSEDPKVRAAAIREIALSGNQFFLPLLIEIAENDPDPRLREYAQKAAKHLYDSKEKAEAEKASTPAPPPESQAEPVKTEEKEPAESPGSKVSSKDRETANAKVQRALTFHMYGQTQKAIKALIQALDKNPYLAEDDYTKNVAAELTGQPSDLAIEALKDPSLTGARPDSPQPRVPGRDRKAGRQKDLDLQERESSQRSLVQSWLSFFGMSESFFQAEARKANGEDTLLSVLVFTIASVVIFMINGFLSFQGITTMLNEGLPGMETEMPPMDFNIGILFFAILIGTVIMSPLSFYLSVGMQYLGGRLFGGSGTFQVHAYLMALVQVPMIIVSGLISLLSLVPIITYLAGLAGFVLSIYTIILTVRLVKVTHGLETGRAVAAVIVPPIVLTVIGGCLFMIVGSSLLGALMGAQ
jgi:hypothetical protein